MTAWTDALRGRDSTRFGRDISDRGNEVGYAGPADGDFARYVDQLLSNAETQRRAQTRAPAPVHDARTPRTATASRQSDPRRPSPQAGRNPTADSLERLRSQAQDVIRKPALKTGMKLLPLLVWVPVALAIVFWQGGMVWLIGLILVGSWVVNMFRKVLGHKKG